MAKLYTSPAGLEVKKHSYSSGQIFKTCRQKYYLRKVRGFKPKGTNAAAKFGIAVENAIQFFHENKCVPGSGPDQFKIEWLKFKEVELLYKEDKKETWAEFYRAGSELLALYEILLPTLPIKDPVFQGNFTKDVFPGTTLGDLQDQGYVDMISRAPWDHPLLPKAAAPAGSPYRVLGIDIKTSGAYLDPTPGIVGLDPQLRRYAWLSGYQDWAFLWLQRSKPDSFEKGTKVTFLEKSGKWTPGDSTVVWQYDKEADTLLIAAPDDFEGIAKRFAGIKGKGTKDRTDALKVYLLQDGLLTPVPGEAVTKQKIQFAAARISPEDIHEEGEKVAREIVDIADCAEKNFWPKDGGVRFPNNICTWCEMRGICLKDDKLVEELLVQITPAEPEKDWLDDLEESDAG